jgi:hypothetical protein
MRKEDVPQDDGPESELRRLMWAVDENGRYVTVPSVGWDPSNTGFVKYWEFLGKLIHEARHAVARGEKSPLWYWMTVNILDEKMLAGYVGIWKWRVHRHMRPAVFAKLAPAMLARYAAVLRISSAELQQLPATDPSDLPIPPAAASPPASP